VHKTTASQNGDIGIPMTLLALQKTHEIAIVEIGIDRIGAMVEHEKIVLPDLSIVTSIGEEHLAGLRDIQTVACEETLLLEQTLKRGGKAFLCIDDPWLERFFSKRELIHVPL
jgi:UDP-N-acetylmuramoyl-tripeptide--D-alanyl-D-alanine ligase